MRTFKQFLVEDANKGKLYLMRHGSTILDVSDRSDGWLDFPLSDEGRLGLIKAQQYLKNCTIETIYASPLKRTVETAEIMKSGILSNPNICVEDAVKTWNLGSFAGTPKKPNKPLVKHLVLNPDSRPEHGETLNEFRARFLPWFEQRKKDVLDNHRILIILSGSNLRELSKEMTGSPQTLNLDESGLVLVEPSDGGWSWKVIFGKHMAE